MLASVTENAAATCAPEVASGRLISLDVFRGLAVAAMILVNNPGDEISSYAPLRHAEWHGCTLADLVFPFFLFAMGVSLVFSLAKRGRRGQDHYTLFRHTIWRSLALVAIGLVLNGAFYLPWSDVRIPGVLQRIGLVYFFTATLLLATKRGVRITVAVGLLLGYWALLMLVPVPAHGAANLDPSGNLASYVDRRLMAGHLWKQNWDPEGVLSTLPAIATALLGTFAGECLATDRKRPVLARRLFVAGGIALIMGVLWGRVFPINKNLWTSSFVLYSGGIAAVMLAACYWAIDERGSRRWAKLFVCFGANPLAVYAGSEIVAMGALRGVRATAFSELVSLGFAPGLASLSWAAVYVLIWGAIAWIMYRNTIFIKL